jgi:GTPase Era involved in 16S rRNA processing
MSFEASSGQSIRLIKLSERDGTENAKASVRVNNKSDKNVVIGVGGAFFPAVYLGRRSDFEKAWR